MGTTRERVLVHLGWIYPHLSADQADQLAGRLCAAVGVEGDAEHLQRTFEFAGDEVMLITYGDTIQPDELGSASLASLGEFWVDHFGETFSTVHVLPFFPSSSDGGFSIVDYRRVAQPLGDWSDLHALVGERDLMVDLVCNHGSAQSEWFSDFVADREPGRSYFATASPDDDLSAVVRPRTHPLLRQVDTEAGIRHVWTTFSPDQVDFDFSNPDVLVEFCAILGFYITKGATRIRLDAIAFLWKQIGTSCLHLPQTHQVVKLMRTLLGARDPSLLVVTETNVPHRHNVSYFGDGDEAHVVYNFTLAPLVVWSALMGQAETLTSWLGQLEAPPAGATFLNFLASHDGIGLRPVEDLISLDEIAPMIERATQVGGNYSAYSSPGGPRPYELNVSLADLLAGPNGETADRYVVAHAAMLAMQGIPAMYIHSMLVSPGDTTTVGATGHKRDINRAQIAQAAARERLSTGWRAKVFSQLTHLISVRRSQAAFGPDSPQTVHVLHPSVVVVERGTKEILAVHNLSAESVDVEVPPGFGGADLITSAELVTGTNRVLTLAPWQAAWLVDSV